MKNKKVILLLLSLTLLVGIVQPGTLAVFAEESAFTCDTESGFYAEASQPYIAPEVSTEEEPEEEPVEEPVEEPEEEPEEEPVEEPVEEPEENPVEEPAFTCDIESGFYAEASLLYAAPGVLAEEDRICTCNPSPAEGEEHQKDCPLYVEQAGFESDTADLIITKQNMDEGQSSIFDVTSPDGYSKRIVINGNSSVTIKGLKSGTYTVTEVTAWQHTAGSNSQSVTLQSSKSSTVCFTDDRSSHQWLSGNAYNRITFGN